MPCFVKTVRPQSEQAYLWPRSFASDTRTHSRTRDADKHNFVRPRGLEIDEALPGPRGLRAWRVTQQ